MGSPGRPQTTATVQRADGTKFIQPISLDLLPYGTVELSPNTYMISNYENTGVTVMIYAQAPLRIATYAEMMMFQAQYGQMMRQLAGKSPPQVQQATAPVPVQPGVPMAQTPVQQPIYGPVQVVQPVQYQQPVQAAQPAQSPPVQAAQSAPYQTVQPVQASAPAPVQPVPYQPVQGNRKVGTDHSFSWRMKGFNTIQFRLVPMNGVGTLLLQSYD